MAHVELELASDAIRYPAAFVTYSNEEDVVWLRRELISECEASDGLRVEGVTLDDDIQTQNGFVSKSMSHLLQVDYDGIFNDFGKQND